jgi:hypothetical protein
MGEFALTRAPGDRRLYVLANIGTVRLPEGWRSPRGRVEGNGRTWEIARGQAIDETGTIVGSFQAKIFRSGGILRWIDRELKLRRVMSWRPRYVLADGEQELAVFERKVWARRRVKVTVDAPALDPGLMLFAAYVVLSGEVDPD